MSDNNEFNGSRYAAIKAEIAAAERELEEKKKALEAKRLEAVKARAEERDQVIYDIRLKIVEFGLYPKELYPHPSSTRELREVKASGVALEAPQKRPSGAPGAYRHSRGTSPPRYEWQGYTWSGIGRVPAWYKDALASGLTEEQLRVKQQ